MELFSFILVCIYCIGMVVGTIIYIYGVRTSSYERVNLAIKVVYVAVVAEFLRVIPSILLNDALTVASCVFCTMLGAITLVMWAEKLKTFTPKLTDQQRAAIEHAKIIDELNDLYLHPDKVVDDKQ